MNEQNHENIAFIPAKVKEKRGWKGHIPISKHLETPHDGTPGDIVKRAHDVAREIKMVLPVNVFDVGDDQYDGIICEAVEYLEDFNMDMNPDTIVEKFDDVLEEIYDWANEKRYWMGE